MTLAEQITKLCNQRVDEYDIKAKKLTFGGKTQFTLIGNGIEPHNLVLEEINVALKGLNRVMLRPNYNSIVGDDHFLMWGWCAHVILFGHVVIEGCCTLMVHEAFFEWNKDDAELRGLFNLSANIALSGYHEPISFDSGPTRQGLAFNALNNYKKRVLRDWQRSLAYASLPLLEGMLKKTCSDYIDLNGNVLKQFRVVSSLGKVTEYGVAGAKGVKSKCSSIRDLLLLFLNYHQNSNLVLLVTGLVGNFKEIEPNKDPIDLIADLRNSSLHGAKVFPTIGGAIFNISIALAMNNLKYNYDDLKDEIYNIASDYAKEQLQKEDWIPRWPESFYPLF